MIEQLRSSLTQKYSKLLSRRLRCSSTEDHCYIRQKKSVSPFHLRSVKSNQTSFLFSKVKTAEFLKKYPAVVYCFKNFQVIGGKLLWLIKMRLTRWRQRGLFNGDAVKWSCDWQTKVRLCLPCRLISSSLSKFERPLPELKKKKTGKGKDYPWGQGLGAAEDYGDSISVPPPKPPTKKSRWRLLEFWWSSWTITRKSRAL